MSPDTGWELYQIEKVISSIEEDISWWRSHCQGEFASQYIEVRTGQLNLLQKIRRQMIS